MKKQITNQESSEILSVARLKAVPMAPEKISGVFVYDGGVKMSMKLRYINGEKVYVEDVWSAQRGRSIGLCGDGTVQICKHREIVRVLNKVFEEAEKTPDEVPRNLHYFLYQLLLHYKDEWGIHVEFVDPETVNFNDPIKVQKKREPKLYTGTNHKQYIGKLTVKKGGLDKPQAKYDILTVKGKAFMLDEQTKPDQPSI